MALKRIYSELNEMQRNTTGQYMASVMDEELNGLFMWWGTINGPPGSPYEGGEFYVKVIFSDDYPYRPPKVDMSTRIYHPNINERGNIKLDILKAKWSPANTMCIVFEGIIKALADPDPDKQSTDPLMPAIAHIWKTDREKFNKTARELVQRCAITIKG